MQTLWLSTTFWLCGIMVLILTMRDFLATVLTVTGGGPMTGRLHTWTWRGLLLVHRRTPCHSQLARAGPVFAISAMMFWCTGLWLGWTLVFCGDPQAVIASKDGTPAAVADRVYFVGYTLTTLGLGDFAPQGSLWKIATVLASASGLLLFTMAITYIVPVLQAIASMRALAAYLRRLGSDPDDIVKRSWNDEQFESVSAHLTALAPSVDALAQQFLAYPILHYFHSPERDTALPVQLAALDEALTVLSKGVATEHRLPTQVVEPLRRAIAGFLEVLHSAHIDPSETPAPVHKLSALGSSGIPIQSQEEFARSCAELSLRRRRLLALVEQDGWCWTDVTSTSSDT